MKSTSLELIINDKSIKGKEMNTSKNAIEDKKKTE
jgi:hypothetical protein